MKSHRIARVNEVIREVAAETILFKLNDPRVKNVTVTRVETAGDLQHAKVYISVMGSERDEISSLTGLKNAAGFIQSKLADRLKTRFLPALTFVIDKGLKNSLVIQDLLRAELPRPAPEVTDPGDDPAPADGPAPHAAGE